MAAINSCTLAKLPRRIRWLRRSRKNRSIMLSQEAPVRGCFLLQPLEELQPFAMHMPGHASTDHVAVQDVERGEQRARPIARVLQCVACGGVSWVVLRTIAATRAAEILGLRPGRGASRSIPAKP